jgi:N-formylglutamate amidohydrolase
MPFRRIGPARPTSPVVLSVPHAGRDYSPALLDAARVPQPILERLEDPLVDRLVWRAAAEGASGVAATSPRAEIDLNRDEREIEPNMILPSPGLHTLMQSPRTRGGLGLIPARIAGAGPIWRQRLPARELKRRIEEIHRPYHAALGEALAEARRRFGIAILLDCHSMPPRGQEGGEAQIVLGDRHGSAMAAEYAGVAEWAVRQAGFSVSRNAPYAGGHITARHGRPAEGVHALQLEIDRSLYLGPDMREAGPGFDRVARLIASLAAALAALALPQAIAAE